MEVVFAVHCMGGTSDLHLSEELVSYDLLTCELGYVKGELEFCGGLCVENHFALFSAPVFSVFTSFVI